MCFPALAFPFERMHNGRGKEGPSGKSLDSDHCS
jgi:hypothetical protein